MNNLVNNLLSSASGKIEKAYIEIEDRRGDLIVNELQAPSKEDFFETSLDVTGVYSFESKKLGLDSSIKLMLTEEEAKELEKSIRDFSSSIGIVTKKKFIVKFNPNTLNIQAMGGGKYGKTNYENGIPVVKYTELSPHIQVSMKLIFDVTKRPVLQNIKDTVKPQVEGFIAALRNPRTRHITFAWGKMCYTGILNSVDINYTMFSYYGRPIRAEVAMSIVCIDDNLESDNMGSWQKYYMETFQNEQQSNWSSKAFGEDRKNMKTNITSWGDKLGSLININL